MSSYYPSLKENQKALEDLNVAVHWKKVKLKSKGEEVHKLEDAIQKSQSTISKLRVVRFQVLVDSSSITFFFLRKGFS